MAKKTFQRSNSNFINSIFFYKVSSKLRYACATSLDSQKNILFNDVKFDLSCHVKKIKLALYLQNKRCYKIEKNISL
jgi:hypothetical protein